MIAVETMGTHGPGSLSLRVVDERAGLPAPVLLGHLRADDPVLALMLLADASAVLPRVHPAHTVRR